MLNTNPPGLDFAALRTRIDGVVSTPGDPNWDEARQAWNLAVDQRPAAVAIPEAADEVVSIVEFARERGLRVTAQGTGHNAAAYASSRTPSSSRPPPSAASRSTPRRRSRAWAPAPSGSR
jgi:hypothetical protein